MQPTAIHHNERVAFIQASWHKEIVDQSRKGFLAEMLVLGYQESDIDFFEVGGAFEIPLHAKLLAKTGRYAGIVGAALVVDGAANGTQPRTDPGQPGGPEGRHCSLSYR